MDEDLCKVGILSNDQCHKMVYTKSTGLTDISSYSKRERNLLLWRSGLSILNVNVKICFHHEQLLLNRFASSQKNCINPFKRYKTNIKGKNISF